MGMDMVEVVAVVATAEEEVEVGMVEEEVEEDMVEEVVDMAEEVVEVGMAEEEVEDTEVPRMLTHISMHMAVVTVVEAARMMDMTIM